MGKGCPKCGNHLSVAEDILFEELSKKIGAENIVRRDESILCGKEIDLYIPKNKVGIEFDGLRWHSEEFKDGHDYHLKKTTECAEKGVTLLHIFEDEFLKNRNQSLPKSIFKPKDYYLTQRNKIDGLVGDLKIKNIKDKVLEEERHFERKLKINQDDYFNKMNSDMKSSLDEFDENMEKYDINLDKISEDK